MSNKEKNLIEETKKLPDEPGVYFFHCGTEILYIGKATSLRNRVRSYFSKDLIKTRGLLFSDLISRSDKITFQQSDSVLEALVLESFLIKKYKPYYNTKEKDDKSFVYVVVTDEEFPIVTTIRGRDLEHLEITGEIEVKYQFGPFVNGVQIGEALKIIRRIFPFRDENCIPYSGKVCFNHHLGLCPGVCIGAISKQEYAKTIRNIKLFFEGQKSKLIKQLKKEMDLAAKEMEFERAGRIKRQIFSLEHIQDSSLIREKMQNIDNQITGLGKRSDLSSGRSDLEESSFRIEAYDIAHMAGKSATGVMVVVENGYAKKSDYRMFRIRKSNPKGGGDDVGSLKEVLNRRLNHPEWPYPNLIVLDGGVGQLNMGRELLAKRGFDISLVAVTKNEKHKPKMIIGDPTTLRATRDTSAPREKEILLANSEAHRFTLKYHRNLRSRTMFEN